MKFVLIIAFVTGSGSQLLPAFSMQEFDSKSTCEQAKKTARRMSNAMAPTGRQIFDAECEPK
jgi:hypothetical protein